MSQSTQSADEGPKCDFCEEDIAVARKACTQCKACFCLACHQQFHTRGAYKKHTVVPVDEYQHQERNVCPDHNETLKLFCKSCMKSLCLECFLGCHAAHTVVHLQEYASLLKGDLDRLLGELCELATKGEPNRNIDVQQGMEKILNNVQNATAERKSTIDKKFQDLIAELGRTWTEFHEECDQEHRFIIKTLKSALNCWKTGSVVGSPKKHSKMVSGLEVIKHRMLIAGGGSRCSQDPSLSLSPIRVPLHECIWHNIPRGSAVRFEPECRDGRMSETPSDLDFNSRLVNICGMEQYRHVSQEELRLDDYLLGRVKIEVVSTLPRELSRLNESSPESSSNQRALEFLSTVKPPPKTDSPSGDSFVLRGSFQSSQQWQSLFGISWKSPVHRADVSSGTSAVSDTNLTPSSHVRPTWDFPGSDTNGEHGRQSRVGPHPADGSGSEAEEGEISSQEEECKVEATVQTVPDKQTAKRDDSPKDTASSQLNQSSSKQQNVREKPATSISTTSAGRRSEYPRPRDSRHRKKRDKPKISGENRESKKTRTHDEYKKHRSKKRSSRWITESTD